MGLVRPNSLNPTPLLTKYKHVIAYGRDLYNHSANTKLGVPSHEGEVPTESYQCAVTSGEACILASPRHRSSSISRLDCSLMILKPTKLAPVAEQYYVDIYGCQNLIYNTTPFMVCSVT